MTGPYGFLAGAEGSALCRLSGAEPAGFLNRCAAAGIRLNAVEPESATALRLTMPLRALPRAQRLAVRCQCELTPLRRRGASILLKRIWRRRAAVFCLLAAFLLLAWSKLFIWEIEVTGNRSVSTGAIRGALSDCGVGIGSFWPDIISDNLRSELLVRLPELAWATVNIHGSRAEVIVRERVAKPELFDENEPVDIVAERTGFVTEVRALCGTAMVRPGSAVLPGEVLIAGRADSAFSGERTLHAVGSVQAETYYTLSAAAPVTETVTGPGGARHDRWALLIGKKRVNFYRNASICTDNCDKITSVWECSIKGLFTLPLALMRIRCTKWECAERPRDKTALRMALEQQLHAQLLSALDGGEIEQEHFSCSEADGRIVVCLRARCSENIAKEQKK